jgi:hypothetical protein
LSLDSPKGVARMSANANRKNTLCREDHKLGNSITVLQEIEALNYLKILSNRTARETVRQEPARFKKNIACIAVSKGVQLDVW